MRQEPTAIQQRVLEAMKEWDVNRLRSELSLMVLTDSDATLSEQFFDDIATEEEAEAGVLEGMTNDKVYVPSDKQSEFDANFTGEEKLFDVVVRVQHSTSIQINAHNEKEAIEKAKQKYYDGELMPELQDSEYVDGLTDVTADESM